MQVATGERIVVGSARILTALAVLAALACVVFLVQGSNVLAATALALAGALYAWATTPLDRDDRLG